MKATIEKSLELKGLDLEQLMKEFNMLLIAITISKDENMLRNFMNKNFKNSKFFKFGFGSSHLWVHQINCNERFLIVYF